MQFMTILSYCEEIRRREKGRTQAGCLWNLRLFTALQCSVMLDSRREAREGKGRDARALLHNMQWEQYPYT